MTFACRTLLGFGTGGVISTTGFLADTQSTPTACSASATFNRNGSITGFSNSGLNSLPPRWTNSTGTPGDIVWLRWTDNTGKAATSGFLQNTIYPLSSAVTIGWAHAGPYNAIGTATVNFYADSGATQLLGTIVLTVDIESN